MIHFPLVCAVAFIAAAVLGAAANYYKAGAAPASLDDIRYMLRALFWLFILMFMTAAVRLSHLFAP